MAKIISSIPKTIPAFPLLAPIESAGIPQAKAIIPSGIPNTSNPNTPQMTEIVPSA